MKFRKSTKIELSNIMDIIKQAQAYFKENGIDQWQNNYPNTQVITNDIDSGNSYVLTKDDKIIGTTVITFEKEKSYHSSKEVKWLTNTDYGVIHRIAIDNTYKRLGLSHKIIKFTEEICLNKGVHSIRVDTHEKNIPMQSLLKKNGFEYCGVIYLADGAKRVAFEKIIK